MDRDRIIRGARWMVFPITVVTFAIYLGIAIVLSILAALTLVYSAQLLFAVLGSAVPSTALHVVLQAILFTIIIVEILETVLVYFRTSRILVRPILIAGITAMVRKVITMNVEAFDPLGLLAIAVVIGVLTASIIFLGKEEGEKPAKDETSPP